MLTASLALLVFLAFLLFAAQLLVNLYATSTVTSAAHRGARQVASDALDHHDAAAVRAARERAEQTMRALLGAQGTEARFDWSGSGPAQVVLRVRLDTPALAPFGAHERLPFGRIDRTVHARVEELR
jgi:hypothetical protein